MAKKGGVQQLQADIQTDEEFDKFLDRKGLLIMDVYTDWCGPCLAMVGSLKKIKLELGGDNLQLAICKSDTIQALKRFHNKSEPTWLMASQGRIVNILFGTNVPRLMTLIAEELEKEVASSEGKATDRKYFQVDELLPVEQERLDVTLAAENEAKRVEQEAAEKKRRDYLTYVTTEITTNLPDCGITIFGPHVNRDLFKKISEPAENLMLTCRDRKILQIVPENLEVLHFKCENPLDAKVLDYMFNKDLLICMWKIEVPEKPIEEALHDLVEQLTKPQPVLDEFGQQVDDQTIPAIIESLEVVPSKEKEKDKKLEEPKKEEAREDDDLEGLGLRLASFEENLDEGGDDADVAPAAEEKEEPPAKKPEKPKKDSITKVNEPAEPAEPEESIIVPAIWTPVDKITNAAAIYLYFRSQAEFLPPDPIPDPPHLAIVFEAYKRKEIFEVCDGHQEAILAYGYFDGPDPVNSKLVANSTKKYESNPPSAKDKLVIKVAKVTSHALLALSAHSPSYVSPNTVVGQKECLKFFPEGYKTGENEEEASNSQVEMSNKKKKKKKKKGEGTDSDIATTAVSAAEVTEDAGGEIEGEDGSPRDDQGMGDGGEGPESPIDEEAKGIPPPAD